MRRFALPVVAAIAGFGIAAACGEPYEGEIPPPADASADAPVEVSSDAGIVQPDAPPPPPLDATSDATSDAPAIDASCSDPCDCDGDGFVTYDAAVCPDSGLKARADCDDLDVRAHPDAGFLNAASTPTTKGDWNCDTTVTRERPVNFSCASLAFTACSGKAGFSADPECGTPGQFVTCKNGLAACEVASSEIAVQGCK